MIWSLLNLYIFNFVASLLSLAVTYRVSVDFLSFPYYNDLVREVMIKKVSLRIAINFKNIILRTAHWSFLFL